MSNLFPLSTALWLRLAFLLTTGTISMSFVRKKNVLLPMAHFLGLMILHGLSLIWMSVGFWPNALKPVTITLCLLGGIIFTWDLTSSPRWYYLKGFDLRYHRQLYNALSSDLIKVLNQTDRPPSDLVFLPQGSIGLREPDELLEKSLAAVFLEERIYLEAAANFTRLLVILWLIQLIYAGSTMLVYVI